MKDVTPGGDIVEDEEEQEALNKQREVRSQFKFSMVGINSGETLNFLKDENLTAEVVNDRQIRFEEEVTSTTNSAITILQRMGYKLQSCQGPAYWKYNGKTLNELRNEMEES